MVPLSILAAQSAILSMADQQSRLILSCFTESAMARLGDWSSDSGRLYSSAGSSSAHRTAQHHTTPPHHATDTPDFLEPRHPALYTITVTVGASQETEGIRSSPSHFLKLCQSLSNLSLFRQNSHLLSSPRSLLASPLTVIVGVVWS